MRGGARLRQSSTSTEQENGKERNNAAGLGPWKRSREELEKSETPKLGRDGGDQEQDCFLGSPFRPMDHSTLPTRTGPQETAKQSTPAVPGSPDNRVAATASTSAGNGAGQPLQNADHPIKRSNRPAIHFLPPSFNPIPESSQSTASQSQSQHQNRAESVSLSDDEQDDDLEGPVKKRPKQNMIITDLKVARGGGKGSRGSRGGNRGGRSSRGGRGGGVGPGGLINLGDMVNGMMNNNGSSSFLSKNDLPPDLAKMLPKGAKLIPITSTSQLPPQLLSQLNLPNFDSTPLAFASSSPLIHDPIPSLLAASRVPAQAGKYFHTPEHLLADKQAREEARRIGREKLKGMIGDGGIAGMGGEDPVEPWGFERREVKMFPALMKRNFWCVQEHQVSERGYFVWPPVRAAWTVLSTTIDGLEIVS